MGTNRFLRQGGFVNLLVPIGERLREERQRLGVSQTAFGEVGGVTKKTQMLYESGERAPDAEYLASVARAGVDVRYVVTGEREYSAPPPLNPEEQHLVQLYREASKDVRRAAIGALVGGQAAAGTSIGAMTNTGGVQVGIAGGKVSVRKGR